VQPVQAPAWGVRPRAVWLAAALAVLVLGVAGVLLARERDASPGAASARSSLAVIGGKPLQQASCTEWLGASLDERAAVVAALKANVGGATPYGPGRTLATADAYRLFDARCARAYARGFLLYELYTRAAAFQAAPQRFQ
jgi:hypothetical protein